MVCTVGHPCLPIPSPAKPDASLLRGQPVLRLATDQHIGPVNSSHAVRGSTAAQVRLAVVTASFKSQEDRDKWVGDLKAAAPGSRDEAGTLSYQLSIGVKDALKVVIIERYKDQAAVDAHMSGVWPPLKEAWESKGFSTTPGSPDFDVQLYEEADVGFMSK